MLIIRKIAIILLFSSLVSLLGSTFMLTETLNIDYWVRGIYCSCFVLFICSLIIVFLRYESSEVLLLKARARKIEEDEKRIQQLRKEYEAEVSLLANKEKQVKQKLMQYMQYAEFPDQQITESNHDYFDDEVAELLEDKAEIIFDKIIHKKYMEKSDFKHELLLGDIVDLIDSVARIHHPESEHPLLETSIENLLRSLNRLSLQLLVLIDSFPLNIKEYNLRKTYLYIQKSATTIGYYKKAEPYLTFATPMLRIGLAANPMVGIAQTVAIEVGKQAIKTGSERYALNLLHDVIEIIGDQASTIFGDNNMRYRSKNWIYAVELTELVYCFYPVDALILSKVMKIINGLSIRSEYDRIYIYQCITQNKSADPEQFPNDFLSVQDKQDLAFKLRGFVENTLNKNRTEENDKKILSWRKKAERRLAVKLSLNVDNNDVELLKDLLNPDSPEKRIKPFLARTMMAMMAKGESPQFIFTDIHLEQEIQSVKNKQLWLIGSEKQLYLLNVDKDNKIKCIWRYDPKQKNALSFQRIKNVVADDCKITGGLWQGEMLGNSEPVLIIEGRKINNYEHYFRVLENFKGVD